jgi:3-deoxy-7-phosphoheptulonate synthase
MSIAPTAVSEDGLNITRLPLAPRSRVTVGDVTVGDGFVVFAGPCAVESSEQMQLAAALVARHGAHGLRGGAFKPRTSPHSFQGLGEPGLALLSRAGRRHLLPVVTEVMDTSQIARVAEHAELLQVGARNMQNFSLLKALSRCRRPVLLKRGLAATVDEWLSAADYLLEGGNDQIILCERGIRTFETKLRNTLDLGAVTWLKRNTPFPVLVDPSHACGDRDLVVPLALAAAAAGADGLLVEVHPEPHTALCDGAQALDGDRFAQLMAALPPLLASVGRGLHTFSRSTT